MSINRGMDKEDVTHVHNGLLLDHKKERNCAICRDLDGPEDCHTELRMSQRENKISYNIAYMWNQKNKRLQTNFSTKQKELQTWLLGGKGRDKIENWD